jgi:hypothetical protein
MMQNGKGEEAEAKKQMHNQRQQYERDMMERKEALGLARFDQMM